MKKLNKYLMGFNLLIIFFGLLVLPFAPVARLSVGKLPEQVLSFKTSTDGLSGNAGILSSFSQIVATTVVEASMSKTAKDAVFNGVIRVRNTSASEKKYKVSVSSEFGDSPLAKKAFEARAFFVSNSLDTVTLAPGHNDDVDLIVKSKSDKNFAKFIVVVLGSL